MYVCKKISKISLVSFISSLLLSIILLVVSYFLFEKTSNNQNSTRNNQISSNYANMITRTITYTTSHIIFGREFMARYDIYNSTLTDYDALSSVNDSSVNEFVYGLNIYYNISNEMRPAYEKQLTKITGKNTSFVGFKDNTKDLTILEKKDWYCPLFFVSPLSNIVPISYIPGYDICSLSRFKKQIDQLIGLNYYERIITPRKAVLTNFTFIDISEKTPNGIVVFTLLIDNIASLLINSEHKIKLIKDDIEFYNNCHIINCYTDNSVDSNIMLPNNEIITMTVYFPYVPKDINSSFLYILIAVIIVNVFILFLIFNFEVDKNKYVIANTMLGYVNHEIRNPLNCINGLVEITLVQLESGEIQLLLPEIISNLGTAKRACEMLTHIVNDILDLKRINDGKLVITKQNVNIQEFLLNLRKIVNPKLSEKFNLDLIYENPDNINNIYSDYQRLLQILLNLLTNSIKFTESGKIILKIEKYGINNVKFSVKDTGRGIDKKYYNNIFKPFEQINLADNLRQGGIGLGLYLCRLIITALKGNIGFESEVNVGSTFWIILNDDCLSPPDIQNDTLPI